MTEFEILNASVEDEEALCDMFIDHITSNTEYISHGEIQMGVGEGSFVEGKLVARPSAKARHFWMKYIHGNITSPEDARVFKAVAPDGGILGFCVVEIQEDGAEPYGMLCDLLVKCGSRSQGVGSSLMKAGLEWFERKGISDIYLESGLNNHSAHEYFIRKGFVKVSEIYKLA